jgi:hypothetical protein
MSTTAPAAPAPTAEAPKAAPVSQAAKANSTASAFLTSFLGRKPEAAPVATPTPPAATPEVKPAPAAAPAKEEKPKAVEGFTPDQPTPPKRAKVGVDREEMTEIATTAATAAAMAVAKANQAPAPEKAKAPELPSGVSRKIELLSYLEKDKPEVKAIASKAAEFHRKGGALDAYKAKWQEENPKKKFDLGDDEHDEFMADNDPLFNVQEEDWEQAREYKIEKRAAEIAQETTSKTLSQRDQEAAKTTSKSEARQAVDKIALTALASFSPEYAELVKTPEKLSSLDKDDPIAEHALLQSVQRHAPVIEAVTEVFGGVPFNPKDARHAEVERVGIHIEDRIAALPQEDQMRSGKRFVTMQEWNGLTAAQKKKTWSLSKDDIINYLGATIQNEAATTYKRLKPAKQVTETSPKPAETTATESAADAASNDSPSVGGSAAPPPGGKAGPSGSNSPGRFFMQAWNRR